MAIYIGEDCVYGDPISGKSVVLENGKEYQAEFRYEGPQTIINNQAIYHPDATIWAILGNGQVGIPYAVELFPNFWKDTNVTG